MTYKKKLIEVALPLPEINDASAYDKMPGIGPHPKGIHHWWARLPLPTARAVLFASVVDDPSSNPSRYPTEEKQNAERERLLDIVRNLMQKKMHEHPAVYAKARSEMLKHCDGNLPQVLDPFAGGGSIPLEAARLGCEAHAADLNPVAVLLNKCNLELIPKWINHSPVNAEGRENILRKAEWKGARGLAEDMRHYATVVRLRAIQKIGRLYPKVKLPKEYGEREVNVIAWLWARTIQCPNPACSARAPLIRSFWLCRKKPHFIHAKPVLKNKTVSFEISNGGNAEKETTSKKGARCIFCGQAILKAQVRDAASAHGVDEIPLAVVADIGRGKVYLPSSFLDVPKIERPEVTSVEQMMTNDKRWFSPPLYGLPRFSDIFTARQLTAIVTFSDLIKDVRGDVIEDAEKSGLSADDASEYAKTITTFLSLALDRCADFNNSLCGWTSGNQKVMHLFGRQAIPMVWDFAEANILGDSVGAWHTCSDYIADCIEVIGKSSGRHGISRQIDAANSWNNLSGLLVSTDPPYYDNIGYAALSDFFYIWLRRTVGDLYPDLFQTILVPKTPELTAAPERFDGNKEKAKEHFESGFRKAFTALRGKMDPRFPLTVYYAFKQEDEKTGEDQDENFASSSVDLTTGWETLLNALLDSGFEITATWPVRASQKWRMVAMGTNALASYIVLACRPRPSDARQCSRREFMSELKKALPNALKHLQQGNIAPVDFAQAAIGPGMAVYSSYVAVLDAEGKPLTVREALSLINQILDETLAEQEGDFDADTRWALAWFDQAGFNEGEFGTAEILSKAKNTSVDGLVTAGFLKSKAGKVRIMKPSELPAEWDPEKDKRLTVWEMVHHLIRVLESGGEAEAAKLVAKLGSKAEAARELCYRLYTLCERKKRAAEALSYNALVQSWPEISRLATDHSKAEGPQKPQSELFEND
jgi:putative DNA methylase